MKRGWGLRRKVLTGVVAVTGVLLAALVAMVVYERGSQQAALRLSQASQQHLLAESARERTSVLAGQLAWTLSNDLYYFDLQAIGNQLAFALDLPQIESVIVFDAQGRTVHDGSAEISTYGDALDNALVRTALAGDLVALRDDEDSIEAAHRIRIGDEVLGGVLVRMDLAALNQAIEAGNRRLEERLARSSRWRLAAMAVLLALVVLSGLAAGWSIQRQIVRPILRLAGAARRIEAGDYRDIAVDSRRSDELGELERTFQGMAAQIRQTHEEVAAKAYLDTLTGLPNRRAFDERLAAQVAEQPARPFALLFLDLDNLKQVNDQHGHDAGDAALVEFARQAAQHLANAASGQAWLARIGGDEFAVLSSAAPVSGAAVALAEALARRSAEDPAARAGAVPALTASIGIALFPDHARSPSDLLRCADTAMYQAKQAGKRRVVLYRPGDRAAG